MCRPWWPTPSPATKAASVIPKWSNTSAPQARSSFCRLTGDRKSTRLNSSHSQISYAVFCLKKKKHVESFHVYVAGLVRGQEHHRFVDVDGFDPPHRDDVE